MIYYIAKIFIWICWFDSLSYILRFFPIHSTLLKVSMRQQYPAIDMHTIPIISLSKKSFIIGIVMWWVIDRVEVQVALEWTVTWIETRIKFQELHQLERNRQKRYYLLWFNISLPPLSNIFYPPSVFFSFNLFFRPGVWTLYMISLVQDRFFTILKDLWNIYRFEYLNICLLYFKS